MNKMQLVYSVAFVVMGCSWCRCFNYVERQGIKEREGEREIKREGIQQSYKCFATVFGHTNEPPLSGNAKIYAAMKS